MLQKLKAHYMLLPLLILALFVISTENVKLVPYANYVGYSPGATYDLGSLASPDIIKAELTWTMVVDHQNLPSISLYTVTPTRIDLIPLNYGQITYLTSTSLVYEKTADRSSKFYIVVEIGSDGGQADYSISISINGKNIMSDQNTVFGNYHIPAYKFTIENQCKIRAKLEINSQNTQLLLLGRSGFSINQNSKQILVELGPDTYDLMMFPFQNSFTLPITELTPLSLSLETYCDNFCGFTVSPLCNDVNCGVIPYASSIPGQTNECSCLANFNFNTYVDKCIINCTKIGNSTGPITNSIDTCACESSFSFSPVSLRCQLNCNYVMHSTGPFSGFTQTCSCPTYFEFNSSNYICLINCALVSNAVSAVPNTVDKCTCRDHFYFDSSSSICRINCTTIANSIGQNGNKTDQCICQNMFDFSTVHTACIINCSNIAYTVSLVQSSFASCSCAAGFVWKSGSLVCQLDCTALSHSTGDKVTNTIDKCICEPHYYFDHTSLSCVINCSSIPHALTFESSNNTCSCVSKFNFNSSISQCVINCSLVPDSIGPEPNSMDSCVCPTPSVFSQVSLTCGQLNCRQITNSTGPYDIQTSTCNCIEYFYFSTDHKCKINCSKIEYTVGPQPNVNYKCMCRFPLVFVVDQLVCRVDCNKVENSVQIRYSKLPIQQIIRTNFCVCKPHFYYDPVSFACLINCTSITNTIIQNPPSPNTCTCQKYFSFNTAIHQCIINCSLIPKAVSSDHTPTTCACQKGYIYDQTVHECLPICGDSYIVEAEQCDDGNNSNEDSCSTLCIIQSTQTNGLSIAVLSGIIAGGVLLVIIAVVIFVVCRKRSVPLVNVEKTTKFESQGIFTASNINR